MFTSAVNYTKNAIFEASVRYLRVDKIQKYLPSITATFGKMHSQATSKSYKNLTVQVLPALSDNYMYCVIDHLSKDAVIIDPSDASIVRNFLKENPEIQVKAILATHHHWDHVGGNLELQEVLSPLMNNNNPINSQPEVNVSCVSCTESTSMSSVAARNLLPIYGGDDRVDGMTNKIQSGSINLSTNLTFKVLFTPCHTTGHICFYNEENGIVFTGDTLFLTGCGRFFEGTGPEMNKNLNETLMLPDDTDIYCGHEYNLAGLDFAKDLEPTNGNINKYAAECLEKRKTVPPAPTVPGTIAQEKLTNPFLRLHSAELQDSIGCNSDDFNVVMASLRKFKDNWKPKPIK